MIILLHWQEKGAVGDIIGPTPPPLFLGLQHPLSVGLWPPFLPMPLYKLYVFSTLFSFIIFYIFFFFLVVCRGYSEFILARCRVEFNLCRGPVFTIEFVPCYRALLIQVFARVTPEKRPLIFLFFFFSFLI